MTSLDWMKKPNDSQYAGHIGVWWVDKYQMYVRSHEVEDGKNRQGNIHSIYIHVMAWDTAVLNHRSDLNGFPYTHLPRGRIYYNIETKKFYAVGTPELLEKPKFIAELKEQFGMSELAVSTESEPQYADDMAPDSQTLFDTLDAWK
jgi:hypothetical protein